MKQSKGEVMETKEYNVNVSNVDKIIKKHRYINAFAEFIKDVYKELVKLYKNEEIVFNALMQTEIINVADIYSYLKLNNLIDEDISFDTIEELKTCESIYFSRPEISHDENNNFKIDKIDRVILLKNVDIRYNRGKANVINAICSLIKSYYDEYEIKGNFLIEKEGVSKKRYLLNEDDGVITKTFIKENGVGLENGLNALTEEIVVRNVALENYETKNYGVLKNMTNDFFDTSHLLRLILNAELYHNEEELYNELGSETYVEFETLCEKIYRIYKDMFAKSYDYDFMKNGEQEIKALLENDYKKLKDEINSFRRK